MKAFVKLQVGLLGVQLDMPQVTLYEICTVARRLATLCRNEND